jgi:hypothetical protein
MLETARRYSPKEERERERTRTCTEAKIAYELRLVKILPVEILIFAIRKQINRRVTS